MEDYALFLLLGLVAEIIGTVSGFGSSILFVPVASLFFDFKTVLGITAVFHVFSNISKIALFRSGINKNIAIKLGVPALIFVSIGAVLTAFIPTRDMELYMSFALVGLAVYLLINFNKTIKQNNANLYVGGAISGFLAGLFGTGGAIRGITLTAFHLPINIFVATSALIDLGVDSVRGIVYISNGYFPEKYIILIPLLIVIGIVGSYLGKLILKRSSENTFRYIVLITIIVTSIFEVIRFYLN